MRHNTNKSLLISQLAMAALHESFRSNENIMVISAMPIPDGMDLAISNVQHTSRYENNDFLLNKNDWRGKRGKKR